MKNEIGQNLSRIRKMKGMTQRDLSKSTGISQRMIAYYESKSERIVSNHIITLAKILKVSADELLGLKPINEIMSPDESKLWKKLKKISKLNLREQQTIFQLIKTMLSSKIKLKNKN